MITPEDEDRYVKNLFLAVLTVIIAVLLTFLGIIVLSSCSYAPESIENIETDEAVTIRIDKEAFQNKRDLSIYIETKNNNEQE